MEEYEREHTGCARQEAVLVRGGNRLCGELTVQGAKNSTLPLLAAALLCEGETVLHNCPALSDVHTAVTILRRLGCRCTHTGDTLTVCADGMTRCDIPHSLMREMRSSIVFLGAILSRCGEARLSFPGGCELGPRPIDLHLEALRKLGAEIREEHGCLLCTAPGGLRGGFVSLAFPSVGATENLLLAAARAKGTTVLTNAAREPEIEDLAGYLNRCGAHIHGAGESCIVIEGVPHLYGSTYTVMPDRIAAATYMAAAAVTGGTVLLRDVNSEHLLPVLSAFESTGCAVMQSGSELLLRAPQRLKPVRHVRTMPYPGFPTDMQPQITVCLATAVGTSLVTEGVYDNRFRYTAELGRMGANIQVEGKTAIIDGVQTLRGCEVRACDLRAGAAMVIAAMCAEGMTLIEDAHFIERGYEDIVGKLTALGAHIRRIETYETPSVSEDAG